MKQFQIRRDDLHQTRLVDIEPGALKDGQIRVVVEKFGFSANNATYAVAGETLGYWKFFPSEQDQDQAYGVLPVWGFARITQSNCEDLPVGERIFGYFPPASFLDMQPTGVRRGHFIDGIEHRASLPPGYNLYRRVTADPSYDPAGDDLHMLLYPLYLTSFTIWDQLKEHGWYGAGQVIIISASSKTSIGLAYALQADSDAPHRVGITSASNKAFVDGLGIYETCALYDTLEQDIAKRPSVIVDMSGNAEVLGRLHAHLGDAVMKSLDVGLTHWEGARKDPRIIRERREFFFAPSRLQKRMKDWGPEEFQKRSNGFVANTSAKSAGWLTLSEFDDLNDLTAIYDEVLTGKMDPDRGLLFKL